MEEDTHPEISWSDQLENLISAEAERCRGLAYLHQHSEQLASNRNNYIQLPVIILSTLAGVGSTASSSLFDGETKLASIVIGLVSISVGILNTLGGYFAFARKAEGHHIAYLNYSKLFSWIAVELSLPRHERQAPQVVLKQLRDAMERLSETTPLPPHSVIVSFNKRFKDYKNIALPYEVNGLQKITVYRRNPLTSRDETPRQSEQPILTIRTGDSTDSVRTTPRGQEIQTVATS